MEDGYFVLLSPQLKRAVLRWDRRAQIELSALLDTIRESGLAGLKITSLFPPDSDPDADKAVPRFVEFERPINGRILRFKLEMYLGTNFYLRSA